jgi:RNA polymerase sigma-70 factor (ECF subfamily)
MLDEVLNIPLQHEAKIPAIHFSDGTEATDDMLVRAVLGGDEQAFGQIFERHKRLVTRTVGRFFRDRGEIEEFVQQSFTKTYFSLKDFRGGRADSFPAWLTRIVVNICYDEFRRRARRHESTFADEENDENAFAETVHDKNAASPENALAAAELTEKMLSLLDPRDRIAMTLVYSQDYSLNEVADILGITASNLKSRLFRCRSLLKSRFSYLFR